MKINTTAKSRKKLIIPLVVALLLAIGGYAAAASMNDLWPFAGENQSEDKPSDASDDSKNTDSISGSLQDSNDSQKSPDDSEDNPANHIPPKYESPDNPQESAGLTGVISHASVRNNTLVIRTTVNQLLNQGTCSLTLARSSDGKTVTKSAPITAGPSTSACDGFDIPTEELGSGSWNIIIDLKGGDEQGRLTKDISI